MRDCNEQMVGYESSRVKMDKTSRDDIYDKAVTNRKRLKGGLAADEQPEPYGMQTQGSYAMKTMIQNGLGDYDIDDGVYFTKEKLKGSQGADMSALDARKMVCEALQDNRFKSPPQVNKNCVRVYYNEGYHVDVPVYRRTETTDQATGKPIFTYELASSNWKASDALSVTKWFQKRNADLSSDATNNKNNGQFIRIVRLLKTFARSRPYWSGKIASGFALSKLASDVFVEYSDRDDRALRETLRLIQNRLIAKYAVQHPTLNEDILPSDHSKLNFLEEKINDKLYYLDVLDNDDCTHEQAMKAWDKFFKSDYFSEQPDPDHDEGLGGKTSGPAVIKGGPSTRFA